MWVEATSMAGTTFSHKSFLKEIARPGDREKIEAAAAVAEIQSTVVYGG